MKKYIYIPVFAVVMITAQLSAANSMDFGAEKPTFKAGLGAAVTSGTYKGEDTDVFAVPLIFYRSEKISVQGNRVTYKLFGDETISFSALAKWRFDGYEEDDSDYLEGMDDRDMTVDAGFSVDYYTGWGKASLSVVSDLLSKHNGQEVRLSYSKRFKREKFSVTPSAGLVYSSGRLNDYYYGVKSDEALSWRAEYKPSETFQPFAGANIGYEIDEKWSLMGIFGCRWLSSEVTDSPIIDEDFQMIFMAGLMYDF